MTAHSYNPDHEPPKVGRRALRTRHGRVLSVALLAAGAAGQVAVSPSDRSTLEGSSSTSYPLGRAQCRLQQVIGDLPSQAATLRGHAYRRDAITVTNAVDGFRAEVTVLGSLSPRTPATASTTFAENHGTPLVTLVPRTWISFPATTRPLIDPAPDFALRLPYATPFAWPGAGVLCLETVVHDNEVRGTRGVNFSVYEDAHQLSSGTDASQPGYRFGSGCPVEGSTTEAYANTSFELNGGVLTLEVSSRYGAPTDVNGSGLSSLLIGLNPMDWAWPLRPVCHAYVPPLAVVPLPGINDARGHLDAQLAAGPLPTGSVIFAQVMSVHATTLRGSLSDGSRLTVPPPGPGVIRAARVGHDTDATSPTGSRSFLVPVTMFF
jgi:hypothetical protein